MYSTQTLWRPVYYKTPFLLMLVTWIWLFIIIILLTKEIYTYTYWKSVTIQFFHNRSPPQLICITQPYPLFPMIILYSPMIILYSSVQFIKLPIFFNKRQRFFFNVNNLSNPSLDAEPFRQHLGAITFGLRFFRINFVRLLSSPFSLLCLVISDTFSLYHHTNTHVSNAN